MATLRVSDMESHSNDHSSQPVDPIAAFQLANDAQARMAARVRSPWWVHALRGAPWPPSLGLGAPDSTAWMLLGVVGLIALSRRRVRDTGVAHANPDRWRFLALGAPGPSSRSASSSPPWCSSSQSETSHSGRSPWPPVRPAPSPVLGPVADAAARRRMAGDLSAGAGR
nr:hypothetical protein GCM10025699_77200 [Microbacterium flavescens]